MSTGAINKSLSLVSDPGRTKSSTLITRVVGSGLRGGARCLVRTLGMERLHDAVLNDWKIPHSEFAREAIEHAETVHNAIALHTSVGIADRCQPEIALLHSSDFCAGRDICEIIGCHYNYWGCQIARVTCFSSK